MMHTAHHETAARVFASVVGVDPRLTRSARTLPLQPFGGVAALARWGDGERHD
jgi:hypothetical protein